MSGFGGSPSHLERHVGNFSIEALVDVVKPALIEQALTATGRVTQRVRCLPHDLVTWMLIAASLWRGSGLRNVLARLGRGLRIDLGWKGGHPPTSRAITKARDRVGSGPLKWLFEEVATGWGQENSTRYGWRGMQVLAVDGTTLRMPDAPANRRHFRSHRTHGRPTAYPLARVVVVMCAMTHVVLRAVVGPYSKAEIPLLSSISNLPQKALYLLDRGLFKYEWLWGLTQQGSHFVVRAKRQLRLRRVRRLGKRDDIVEVLGRAKRLARASEKPWQLRRICYHRPGHSTVILLTSLLDAEQYPADEIVARYRDRWEVELGYDEIKTHLLGEHVPLRSGAPERVLQETYAYLLAYNVIRITMARVALKRQVDPRRISFVDTLERLRVLLPAMAFAPAMRLPALFQAFLDDVAGCLLPPRRRRRCPRAVKTIPCYYPIRKKRRAA